MRSSARQGTGKLGSGARISLAGRVSIAAEGAVIDEQRFAGRQGRLVFAYLATEHGRPVPREELAELLWGDAWPATWEKALTVIVSKLRALLEECGIDASVALTGAFGCYRLELPPESSVDVLEARRAIDGGDAEELAAAIATADRPFLAGDDGPWIDTLRRELGEIRVRALEQLADDRLAAGRAADAADLAQRVVDLEPYRESGYRRLMEAHSAAGNRAEALRVYERCRRFLADELGAYPSPETDTIYRGLLSRPKHDDDPGRLPQVGGRSRLRRRSVVLAALAVAGVLLAAVGLGSLVLGGQKEEVSSAPARAVATDWCGQVESLAERPELLITSDLPLGGPNAKVARTMADAIRLVLRHHQFEAGPYSLGYQSCNHGSTESPGFDLTRCAANARAFAATPRVVGVIGTYNSPCAMVEVPIANRAADGPLVMISPSNTFPGLTIGGPESEPGEPERFYPTRVRNFFRVVASDDLQAGADALLARTLGIKTFYVLDNGDRYGRFVGQAFRRAARRLGIRTVGSRTWDGKAKDYRRLARVVARARPEGVFLSGVVWSNGGRLVADLRESLGRKVVFIAPDGFVPIPPLLEDAPRAAIGMYISIAGVSNGALNPTGQAFMRELAVNRPGGLPTASYVPEAAQAAEVLLAAISRSDGTRRSVLEETKGTRVENGILGSFFFDRNGDISSAPIAIYRVTGRANAGPAADFGGAVVDRVVHVPLTVVR